MSFDIYVLVKIMTTKSAKQSNHLPCFFFICVICWLFLHPVFVHSAVSHSVHHTAFGQMKTLLGQDCKQDINICFLFVSECHQFILADMKSSLALFLILETE